MFRLPSEEEQKPYLDRSWNEGLIDHWDAEGLMKLAQRLTLQQVVSWLDLFEGWYDSTEQQDLIGRLKDTVKAQGIDLEVKCG